MTGSSYSLDNEVKTPKSNIVFLRLDFVDYNSFSLFLDGLILYKYTHPHKYWHAQR